MFTQIELQSDIQFPTVLNSFPIFTQNIFLPFSTLYSYRYLGVIYPVLKKPNKNKKKKKKKRERERAIFFIRPRKLREVILQNCNFGRLSYKMK